MGDVNGSQVEHILLLRPCLMYVSYPPAATLPDATAATKHMMIQLYIVPVLSSCCEPCLIQDSILQ